MKKVYLIPLLGVLGLFALLVYLNKNLTSDNQVQKEFTPKELWNIEFQKKKEKKKQGIGKTDKPDMFTKYFKDITTPIGEKESAYKMNYKVTELNKAIQNLKSLKTNKAPQPWVQRGPANIGGRTRAIIIDPDDATHQTWFASAATGGIWKTTDGGANWTHLSADLSNLSVNAMAMAVSNTQVIYAGTGEGFGNLDAVKGNGIWKTTDKGTTWTQLASTINTNFAFVNRLIINPSDADIVIAVTETGIYKSANGGTSWAETYSSARGVQDIVADPTDFNILFAGENSIGILRSTDAGDSWVVSSDGIAVGKRYEVDVSPVNNNNVFVSVEISSTESAAYISEDNGLNWKKFNDTQNFLSAQGWYDNTIAAHPYNADEVFIGGVDIWKVKFNGTETTSSPTILGAYTVNTTFLSFVNFGGAYLGGGMSTEDADATAEEVAIEIRFGVGLTQKAHRFTVPAGSTSGVPASSYSYQDYVDVPFQVWDMTNNKQLMVSFRDQANNNEFDLTSGPGDEDRGREYIFVNSIAYNATTPDANIATAGGHLYKNLYMFWPTLAEGETWTPTTLPTSKIVVDYGTQVLKAGVKTSIADSYGSFGGPNGYDQGAGYGTTSIPGLHPDHHSINLVPTGGGNFLWIDGNDGGLGYSSDNGVTLDQIPTNYITTQFYGVAKNPEANEYFGGMQDNGSWQSPTGTDASSSSDYFFRLGGDGFECLWHATDPNLMLGSIYNNAIYRSSNKGASWSSVSGITSDDGPFITKLSVSKEDPYMVFAVSNSGVYKSITFGSTWTKKTIATNWAISNVVSSSHNVEASLANGKYVWAGGGMSDIADREMQISLSSDYGNTFTALPSYSTVSMKAYISGIATHPIDENTAYILFSLSDKPKVLRTTDLGQNWEDISGFGTGVESTTGFPDVVVHCLLVMPNEPDIIWVGTDIGLFVSSDNGVSWSIANNGLPPVSVYDMYISGNQVVVATHGRGIWTLDMPEIDNAPYISDFIQINQLDLNLRSDLKVAYDSVEVYLDGSKYSTTQNPATGVMDFPVTVGDYGDYTAYALAYIGATPYKSNTIELSIYAPTGFSNEEAYNSGISLYPNPANEYFNLDVNKKYNEFRIEIYNIKGQRIYSIEKENSGSNRFNIKSLKEGLYIVNIYTDNKKTSHRMQIAH